MSKNFQSGKPVPRGSAARSIRHRAVNLLQDLESRALLSAAIVPPFRHLPLFFRPSVTIETATAQLNLVSTTGTLANPIYNYDITLTNTGNTNLGSFWFAWVPGQDFLPSLPSATGDPAGWAHAITGTHNSSDGSAIEWVAQSGGAALTPGNFLSGFTFSSSDSPNQLAGNSPTHPATPVLTSFVYEGAPLSDAGYEFVVSAVPASTSSITTHIVLLANTLGLPSGDPVTFTATVSSGVIGPLPTGAVDFIFNGQILSTVALGNDGTAQFTTTTLPQGIDRLTASYNGDSAFSGSVSVQLPISVTPPPHLSISRSPNNGTAGHALSPVVIKILDVEGQLDTFNNSPVTLSLAPGSGPGTLSGTTTVAAIGGIATFNDLSLVKVGAYSLKASDGSLASATTKNFNVAADAATAHLGPVPAPGPSIVGKAIASIITVQILDQFNNLVIADHSTVNLSILAGPTSGALTGVLNVAAANGAAKFKNIGVSAAGSYTLQFVDLSLADPTPVTILQTVNKAATTLAVPRVSPRYTFGKTINLASMLKSNAPANFPFSGTVTLKDQANAVLGTANVSSKGAISFALSQIAASTYTATLAYPGDSNHTAVTSSGFTLQVITAPTVTSLAAFPSSPTTTQPLVLTASVSSRGVSAVPTGSVTFKDGVTVLDTITLDGNGRAVLTIPTPAAGSHNYIAVYAGDANFNLSASASKKLKVK